MLRAFKENDFILNNSLHPTVQASRPGAICGLHLGGNPDQNVLVGCLCISFQSIDNVQIPITTCQHRVPVSNCEKKVFLI